MVSDWRGFDPDAGAIRFGARDQSLARGTAAVAADLYARDAADAVDNYRRVLAIVGDIAGNRVAPRAEKIDREGNTHNDDGTVTLHPLVKQNLQDLAQAGRCQLNES